MSPGAPEGPRFRFAALTLLLGLVLAPLAAREALGDDAEALAPLREALAKKSAEGVLLASLDLEPLPSAAVPLLARGAALANAGEDPLLGMQLCQRALKVQPEDAEALLACIEAARALDQFDPALAWMRTLREAHPGDPGGVLWELRLLEAEGEWKACRAAGERALKRAGPPELLAEARSITGRCDLRAEELSAAKTEVASLMEALAKARADLARTPDRGSRGGAATSRRARAGSGVTVYTTRWCGYCKKAKRWLKKKGVRFTERDIERDPKAAVELAKKAAEQRMRLGGVPVFEVKGELMGGWSEKGLERLLKRHGLL